MRLIDADMLLDKTVRRNSVWNGITNSEGKNLEEIVSELPSKDRSVQDFVDKCRECGKQKTGHWIFKQFDEETGISNNYWCSECGKPLAQVYKTYCANCGAKMVESYESEDNG